MNAPGDLFMDGRIDEDRLYRMIGVRLKHHREQKNLSQIEMSDHIGMLRTSVANIEAGRQRPPLHVLYSICAVLEVEPVQLLPSLEETQLTTFMTIESMTTVNTGTRSLPEEANRVLQSLLMEIGNAETASFPKGSGNAPKTRRRMRGEEPPG